LNRFNFGQGQIGRKKKAEGKGMPQNRVRHGPGEHHVSFSLGFFKKVGILLSYHKKCGS